MHTTAFRQTSTPRLMTAILPLLMLCLSLLGTPIQLLQVSACAPGSQPSQWRPAQGKGTFNVVAQHHAATNGRSLKLSGAQERGLDLLRQAPFDVHQGTNLHLTITFKTAPGTMARWGFYGYNAKGQFCDYNAANAVATGDGWHTKTSTFVIEKPETKTIKVFLNVPKQKTILYSQVSLEKPGETHRLSHQEKLPKWKQKLLKKATESHSANFESPEQKQIAQQWTPKLPEPSSGFQIITDPFSELGHWNRAAALQGGESQETLLILNHPFPVKKGDAIFCEFVFKAPVGKQAQCGIMEVSKQGNTLTRKSFTAIDKGWDLRTVTFTITSDKVSHVRFFFQAPPREKVIYSHARLNKLSPQQAVYFSLPKVNEHFARLTVGNNLARNQKVIFTPQPTYPLTAKNNTDGTDLVDGYLCPTNQLWFEPKAVGFFKAYNGATITIDLGSVRQVKSGVIRLQGGILENMPFPQELEIWVSKDNRNAYLASKLTKLKSTEDYLSNWNDLYYLPEGDPGEAPAYVYPFSLPIMADARFVIFRTPLYPGTTQLSMVCDEIAVMEASPQQTKAPAYNQAYRQEPTILNHTSITLYPKMDTFYIAKDIYLPNLLNIDNRLPDGKGNFTYDIDLPKGVTAQSSKGFPANARRLEKTEHRGTRTVFHFNPQCSADYFMKCIRWGMGPFLFSVKHPEQIPSQQRYVIFTTYINGIKQIPIRRKLDFLTCPKVNLKRLDISLWNDRFRDLPDHHSMWKSLGFTTDMYFPVNVERAKKLLPEILASKANGKRIRIELSSGMRFPHRFPQATEHRCVGADDPYSLCLAYRGEQYRQVAEEVREILRILPADAVSFDIENWEPNRMKYTIAKCTRCQEAKKKAGIKTWVEYFERFQADYVKTFAEAAREGARLAGRKVPSIGFYHLAPVLKYSNYSCGEGLVSLLGFKYLFPKYSDEVQQSAYDSSTKMVHQKMRSVFQVIKNPKITIPWLTAGLGAYYTQPRTYRTEQHIVETLMNGAGGLQFFAFRSFASPLDYFYLARALAMIEPYEDMIMEGSLEEQIDASNPQLLYTARKLGAKILFLAGNYEHRNQATATINLNNVRKVTALSTEAGATLKDGKVNIVIGPDSFGLFLLEL